MRLQRDETFFTHDGVKLFYRHWPAASDRPRGAIVLFHRGHEHSGRMAHLVDELDLPDFSFFAWDARGHGRSQGERGYSPSVAASIRDVDGFIDHVAQAAEVPTENIAVIGQSVGAVLVTTWAHDYAPRIRALVLGSPAFVVKLYVPLARPGLRLIQYLRGNFTIKTYVKPSFLTHDKARIASYRADSLITRPIAVHILLGLHAAAERVVADAEAITIPTQLFVSGADLVVRHAPQHRFYWRLGARIKERHILPGFFHDTFGERDRAPVIATMRRFLLECFAEPFTEPSLVDADKIGFTRQEADRLASPLPRLSPRGLGWAAVRVALRIGGLFAKSIRIGQRTGFDSGSMLDAVYRNDPKGLGPVGRLIDRINLNAIGWRGIRVRKTHLQEIIRLAIERLRARGAPVHVLDIAAGHGRYVIEAVTAETRPDSISLHDFSDLNVTAGRALIADKRLDDIAQFSKADAFDRISIAATEPRPTLGIVSGLYELFADNDLVGRSLAGLADAIAPGGYLIYTGQPWHPQLELIARALTSHRGGQAWVMRRRTQVELDQLVARAGFRKLATRIDEWGIFTVSLAERL